VQHVIFGFDSMVPGTGTVVPGTPGTAVPGTPGRLILAAPITTEHGQLGLARGHIVS
jgi:hypothetical protein